MKVTRRKSLKIIVGCIASPSVLSYCTDQELNTLGAWVGNPPDGPSYNPGDLSEEVDTSVGNSIRPVEIVDSHNLVNGHTFLQGPPNTPDLAQYARLQLGSFPTPGVILRFDHDLEPKPGYRGPGSVYDSGSEITLVWKSPGIETLEDMAFYLVYRYGINKIDGYSFKINQPRPIGWPPKYELVNPDDREGNYRFGYRYNIGNVLTERGPTREVGIFFFGEDYNLYFHDFLDNVQIHKNQP